MAQNKFRGLGIALITPFKGDGSIDFNALNQLVEYQIKGGADFLCIMGTTAETPTLSSKEKALLREHLVERVAGRVPILMGCGGNCTADVVHTLQETDLTGIDGILSVCPYYNKPSQEGIYQHYRAIAQATNMPIILYNVPGRTGVNMKAETVLRLAHEFPNIVAIKEASGNFAQIDEIIKNKPTHFMVISGDDGITFPLITLGAVGVISVVGNAFPREFSRMVRLAIRGDLAGAREIHYRFAELMELLFVDGNPAGVKSLLSMLGFIDNELRLPLVPTTLQTTERIREVLEQIKAIEK